MFGQIGGRIVQTSKVAVISDSFHFSRLLSFYPRVHVCVPPGIHFVVVVVVGVGGGVGVATFNQTWQYFS
jgi:hypothetical protein